MRTVILGGSAGQRRWSAGRRLAGADRVIAIDAAQLPFIRPSGDFSGATVCVSELDRAFPNHQAGGTRLVLTQSTYTLQKWIDAVGPDGSIVATADAAGLRANAAEAFHGRGPWRLFAVVDLDRAPAEGSNGPLAVPAAASPAVAALVRAYDSSAPADRAALAREAAALDPGSPVAQLALASALREIDDLPGTRAALDCAVALAPGWEAAHYEDGKFWLGCDDMARARDAFRRAADLMPSFSAASSNLGAVLGELDEPDLALAAFTRALAHDPNGFQIVNNIGVVSRELGRLDRSEAAFRRVIELSPGFVFGYYNLGHTLFLIGRYAEALEAYEEGQRRDPEKNRRQGCRLAMMRLANGDAAGAERDLWRFANAAPADERGELLAEAYEIGAALLAARPELRAGRPLVDRIGAEIGR